jgi:glycosyltransferase involved in cell wall biosynthesis
VAVFPNGVSHRIFYPRDRTAMRRKYGLPPDAMLVCCVGYFTENKGPARVGEAIRNLPGVAGVFVGSGPTPPTADNIVFRAALPHEGIPEVMSACDVFVLPTRYEGCCSAILEAMSCGLPVISSTGAFNDDILNTQVALRVDPMDIQAIRGSIVRLQQNYALRKSMGRAAMEWSAQFDIDQRAQAILSFMQAEIARNRTADPVQPGVSTG